MSKGRCFHKRCQKQSIRIRYLGKDKGEALETEVFGGTVGLILDGRGRPFELSTEKAQRIENLNKWSKATNEYPDTDMLGGN